MAQNDQPILIAYDGSEYARAAIAQAGEQLGAGRRAIVLTVWQPFEATGFVGAPVMAPVEVEKGVERDARRVADEGAALARRAGFDTEPVVERGDPIWERIVESADHYDASIVVMGSHGRTGISRMLLGSVAGSAANHTPRPVLIAHDGQSDAS